MPNDAFDPRKNRLSRSGMKRLQAAGDQARGSTAPNSVKTATGHHQRRTPMSSFEVADRIHARIIAVPSLVSNALTLEGGGTTLWQYTMRQQRLVGPDFWDWEDVAEGSELYEFTAYNLYELNNPTTTSGGFLGDGRLSNGVLKENLDALGTHSIQPIPAGNTHPVEKLITDSGLTFWAMDEPNGIDGVCNQSASAALQTQNLMESG